VDLLYAIDVMAPGACTAEALAAGTCAEWEPDTVGKKQPVAMVYGERMYLSAATGVGPSADQTLPSRAVSFEPLQ